MNDETPAPTRFVLQHASQRRQNPEKNVRLATLESAKNAADELIDDSPSWRQEIYDEETKEIFYRTNANPEWRPLEERFRVPIDEYMAGEWRHRVHDDDN